MSSIPEEQVATQENTNFGTSPSPVKSVLSIQDICSVGRCAMAVTIPVLSASGVQPIPMPTAVFSNHPWFPSIYFKELTEEMYRCMDCWDDANLTFDAIQTGFLSSPTQVGIVREAVKRYGRPGMPIIVDPAMADHGSLYAVFTDTIIEAMKNLIAEATVITPNYTEALMITDQPYDTTPPTWEEMKLLCARLSAMGPSQVVITSVPTEDSLIRTAVYDGPSESFTAIDTERIDADMVGTGDIFTGILAAELVKGNALTDAVEKAVRFTLGCIKRTHEAGTDRRHGVLLELMLPELIRENNAK